VALVGANGAGKTTLLRTIAGAHRPVSGRIMFDGVDITGVAAYRRVQIGIALVPEGRRLFPGLTVEENLLTAESRSRQGPRPSPLNHAKGDHPQGRPHRQRRIEEASPYPWPRGAGGFHWDVERVLDAFPLLRPLRKRLAATLSGGEQQAAAIGRALISNPRLLLLDEVSLGLAPIVVDTVYAALRSLIDGGTTILLVEQDLARAMSVATRIVCMLEGRVVLEGPTPGLTREQITAAYFGLRRMPGREHR
jgi:branched-chain amino acid transport system ATP-binding protein